MLQQQERSSIKYPIDRIYNIIDNIYNDYVLEKI